MGQLCRTLGLGMQEVSLSQGTQVASERWWVKETGSPVELARKIFSSANPLILAHLKLRTSRPIRSHICVIFYYQVCWNLSQ